MAETTETNNTNAEVPAKEVVAPETIEVLTETVQEPETAVDAGADVDANADVGAGAGAGDDEVVKTKKERAIIRQIEYYFGDANLGRDKFLQAQIAKEEGGWVPFSVLITFKRLASLSTDISVIVDALQKSDEGLLEISEDKKEVRRHPERPLPEQNEERRKEIQTRTIYAKGFPLGTEISELLDFFNAYEKVTNITMRKYLEKATKVYKFKGSVFLTFETKEQAQAFLEKDKIVFKENELLRKWQADYLESKREEQKARADKKKNKPNKEATIELPKAAVIHFSGTPDDSTREQIREALDNLKLDIEIAYIDFNKGLTEGFVRFQTENSANKFIEKVDDNKVKFNDDVTLSVRKATEEEEKAVLEKAVEFMKKRRDFVKNKKGGNRFGNRKRKFGGNNRNDAKKAKTE